ncbi:MAG: basic amino acid ABC transporter substrate-binding protein [Actinomycetota bacterium]
MRNARRIAAIAALAMLAVACGKSGDSGNKPGDTSSGTVAPTISIAECETTQGAQPQAAPKHEDFKKQLKTPGQLNVGSDNAFPPFEEKKPGAKKPDGFDVDLYTEVARRLGLKAVSTTTDFDALFTQSIPAGKFDLGVSAITIKEKRKQTVDFTIPYFQADLSLSISKDKSPGIKSIDDLAGKTIGAQKGTTGEDCAKYLVKDKKAKDVKSYSDAQVAFEDLSAGRIAAVVNDRPASLGFVKKNPALKIVQIISTKEQYGFAISKKKPDLRVKIDSILLAMMKDGTYARIYQKWFGTPPPFKVPLGPPSGK